jgi:hypothetical protein
MECRWLTTWWNNEEHCEALLYCIGEGLYVRCLATVAREINSFVDVDADLFLKW